MSFSFWRFQITLFAVGRLVRRKGWAKSLSWSDEGRSDLQKVYVLTPAQIQSGGPAILGAILADTWSDYIGMQFFTCRNTFSLVTQFTVIWLKTRLCCPYSHKTQCKLYLTLTGSIRPHWCFDLGLNPKQMRVHMYSGSGSGMTQTCLPLHLKGCGCH